MYKSRLKRWLAGLTLTALMAAFIWQIRPYDRQLRPLATKVWCADLKGLASVYWIDSDRLLIITASKPRGVFPNYFPDRWTGKAELLDIRNGRRTTAPGLTRMLNGLHATPAFCESHPSGKGLLWLTHSTGDSYPFYIWSTLDGSRHYDWDLDKFGIRGWVNDHTWVASQPRDTPAAICVFDTNRPAACLKLPAKSPRARSLIASLAPQPFCYEEADDTSTNGSTNSVAIGQFSVEDHYLREDAKPLQTFQLRLSKDMQEHTIDVSSDNSRVLYGLTLEQTPPVELLLHRIVPSFPTRLRRQVSLWISRINGADLHEIGHIWMRDKENLETFDWNSIQWLQDNRRVAFKYHGDLYTVPVE